jgi:hypothetical protein
MASQLTGTHRVRIFRPAFDQVRKLFPRVRDRIEIRRHALKLRFWPGEPNTDERGQVIDLNWSWIKALPGLKIGELRIDDVIDGHDNLRVIFFVGNPEVREPLPMIWVLNVFQKKRDDFTAAQIKIFKGQRQLVIERFYKDRLTA